MTDRTIHPDVLHRWVADLFLASGSSEDEAKLTADHLVLSNLSGHDSHGVGMVPRYVKAIAAGELVLNQQVEIVTDSGSLMIVDAHHGMGQSVTHQAMAVAIERAKATGVCVMGLRNSHHLGRVGHWAEQAVAEGLISIHFTNAVSQHWVAPYGAAEARFVPTPSLWEFRALNPMEGPSCSTSPPAPSRRARCAWRTTLANRRHPVR